MARRAYECLFWNGNLYVPFHTARLEAGPFLPLSPDWVEQYLVLPPELRYGVGDRYVGGAGMPRTKLAAAVTDRDNSG